MISSLILKRSFGIQQLSWKYNFGILEWGNFGIESDASFETNFPISQFQNFKIIYNKG